MNKRDYPLILIDRSCTDSYPYIFVAVLDKTVGFVARVVHFTNNKQYNAFHQAIAGSEKETFAFAVPLANGGGVVLIIEDFFFQFELNHQNRTRIATLLKKATKKVLHAEVNRTPDMKDLDINNQILQQQMTIERAKANFDNLAQRAGNNPEAAKYQIALAEATLETLKKFRDNQKYFAIGSN